jgi:hypothetical protein
MTTFRCPTSQLLLRRTDPVRVPHHPLLNLTTRLTSKCVELETPMARSLCHHAHVKLLQHRKSTFHRIHRSADTQSSSVSVAAAASGSHIARRSRADSSESKDPEHTAKKHRPNRDQEGLLVVQLFTEHMQRRPFGVVHPVSLPPDYDKLPWTTTLDVQIWLPDDDADLFGPYSCSRRQKDTLTKATVLWADVQLDKSGCLPSAVRKDLCKSFKKELTAYAAHA